MNKIGGDFDFQEIFKVGGWLPEDCPSKNRKCIVTMIAITKFRLVSS